MLFKTSFTLAVFIAVAFAKKDTRTFAVNHFYGNGPLTSGRMDPIVDPGRPSTHSHTIQGGSNFNLSMDNTVLMDSKCTSSLVNADKSNYWTPSLYFQAENGSFISVPMYYMNVYYFFEPTDDETKAFPVGLRMMSGDSSLRTPPAGGATSVVDTNKGTIQPVQFTCPRKSYNPPSWPKDSDGKNGVGIQDPTAETAGAGFPHMKCDGAYSPLRVDIHFPSCYNPKAGLRDYKKNSAFPSSKGTTYGSKLNCPSGWIHLPHIFYEVYWQTPLFNDLWTEGKNSQPFILSNGDRTGYSLHGDFIAGWDEAVLQKIIDNCNAGSAGMDKCADAGVINDSTKSCNIKNLVPESIEGVLKKLPGDNPPTGWGQGGKEKDKKAAKRNRHFYSHYRQGHH